MRVICDRPALLDAVNIVSSVVPARSPRPQLMCLKITAAKGPGGVGHVTLSATDAEASIRYTFISADVQKPGEALVQADKFRQIVAAEDWPTLTIESKGDVTEITRGESQQFKSNFKVFGFPVAEYPAIPDFPAGAKGAFTVEAGTLGDLIARTIFAAARETSRYAINGVLLRRDGKRIEMVATDGRRLALARGAVAAGEAGGKDAVSCILPTKALHLALKLIREPDSPVRVAVTENQATLAFGADDGPVRAVLSTILVEGAFPPYEDVIPKEQDKRATFEREALMSGVRRAALLTNEESRGVRFEVDGERLKLVSRAPEMGEADVEVGVSAYEGEPIEIGFNPVFITDALKVISDESVVVELKAPNKPGLIRSGADFLYVVMPVNLQ